MKTFILIFPATEYIIQSGKDTIQLCIPHRNSKQQVFFKFSMTVLPSPEPPLTINCNPEVRNDLIHGQTTDSEQ